MAKTQDHSNKITVLCSTELCVYGKEFRMQRYRSGLSLLAVCEQMNQRGWYYYPSKLYRLEQSSRFCLPPDELYDLLTCISAIPEVF